LEKSNLENNNEKYNREHHEIIGTQKRNIRKVEDLRIRSFPFFIDVSGSRLDLEKLVTQRS